MIKLHQLNQQIQFPSTEFALDEPNGLLAFGGDLCVQRLKLAYENGIFPWFSEGEPILWWSPDPRGILFVEDYHCSKSLTKYIRKTCPEVTLNKCFDKVIEACAHIPRRDDGTWITQEMIRAYKDLHRAGFAHSIEVWLQGVLVGGLYGVSVGNVFCGESMFSFETNGSKIAFHALVRHMQQINAAFIDCQMLTPHLQSLGCVEVSRDEFLGLLESNKSTGNLQQHWQTQRLSVA